MTQARLLAFGILALCGCAAAPLRLGEVPPSKEAREKLYAQRRIRVDGAGQAFAGSEPMDASQLAKHLRASGDLTSGRALEARPDWMAYGSVLALGGMAAAWGLGTYGKQAAGTSKEYNPFEAVPVALLIVETDMSFTLFSRGLPSLRRAADRHNARLQATLGLKTEEGRYSEGFDRWWWRIPAILLAGGAYAAGRLAP